MLEGWRKEEGPCQDPWQPLSAVILKELQAVWATVCVSAYEEHLFYAASLLAFMGELRMSDIVVASKRDVSGHGGCEFMG